MAEDNKTSNSTNNTNSATKTAEKHARNAAGALDARLSGPLAPLEEALDSAFGEKASFQIPKEFKELLVKIAPWLALIGGISGLVSAYDMWRVAHRVGEATRALNELTESFGVSVPRQSVDLSLAFWFSVISMVIFAVLALLAFPGLKDKKKIGWNLMFYSAVASTIYSVATLFYVGGGGQFVGTLVGTLIGFYILFQIRSYYLPKAK